MSRVYEVRGMGFFTAFHLLITAVTKLGKTGPLRPLSCNKCKQIDFNCGSGIHDLCDVPNKLFRKLLACHLCPHNEGVFFFFLEGYF